MTKLVEAISFHDIKYEITEFKGIKIKIATPESLYELKKNTQRDKDKLDALFLKELIKDRKSKETRTKKG